MVLRLARNGLNVVIGRKGSGKSTAAAALSLSWKSGVVLSNVDIKGTYSFNPLELGEFYPPPNSLVIIDEAGIVFNNRSWKAFNNSLIELFKLQRKTKCTIVLFTQAWDIDVSLKRLTDKIFYLKKVLWFTFAHEVAIKWKWTEVNGSDGSEFVQEMKPCIFPSSAYFLPRYWKYFDSFELPPRKDWSKYCSLR